MARELRWWVVATLLACAVAAFIYLPPRGAAVRHPRFSELEPPTPYRLRERALAARWRAAALELQLLEYRDRLRPELTRRQAGGVPGAALAFEGLDTLSTSARRYVAAELDTVWSRLGLGTTKISVGLVLWSGRTPAQGNEPAVERGVKAYLLPDSSDRTTCLVLLHVSRAHLWQTDSIPSPDFQAFLENGLGPCAYYAAFGSPGREIGRWLGTRAYDLAQYPAWDSVRPPDQERAWLFRDRDVRRQPWYWWQVYQFPPSAIACLGGREADCRAAVTAEGDAADSRPRVVTTERWWWRERLFGGELYLADIVREVGRERFQRFWSSELAADTSLAAALRMPVGRWTQHWQSQLAPTIPLGPAAPPSATLLGLLLAGAAVVLVARTVSRREVR